MDTLREFLKSLTLSERTDFAERCGTTVGYLRKATYVGNKLGAELAVAIDRESRGKVRFDELRPDIDWSYVKSRRRRRKAKPASAEASPVAAA